MTRDQPEQTTVLEFLRRARGWSASRLAREAGVHSTTISALERRRLRPAPTSQTLTKLASTLSVPEHRAGSLIETSLNNGRRSKR